MFPHKDQRKYASILWKLKKIQRVVKKYTRSRNFHTAGRTRNMTRVILLGMYKKEAESGLFLIHCFTDNKPLLDPVHSTKTLKEMRLKIDVFTIREMLEKKRN